MRTVVITVLVVPVLGVFAVTAGIVAIVATGKPDDTRAAPPVGCGVSVVAEGVNVAGLDRDQTRNAATIVAQGETLGVPPRGWVVAVATAYVESGVRNLASLAYPDSLNFPHDGAATGDHDSVGVFQQRASWGFMRQRMDPAWSARHFYVGGSTGPDGWHEPGLLDTPGWRTMPVGDAAQTVQVSQYPDAYDAYVDDAQRVVQRLTGRIVTVDDCPTGTTVEPVGSTRGPWTQPLNPGYINQHNFGHCDAGLWANCHTGDDLSVASGPIGAVHAGRVSTVVTGDISYGNYVVVDHGGGVETWYCHMIARPVVTVGTKVQAGDLLGNVGATGNTTGPHLHLEVRVNDEPVDPEQWMKEHGAPL